MKTAQDHRSDKLSSSVAFNAEEDGRRTKKTYIVLSSLHVLPARNFALQMPGLGRCLNARLATVRIPVQAGR
jgi:hypothetical protein